MSTKIDPSQFVYIEEFYNSEEFKEKYTYTGDDLGSNYSKEATTFKVWAPTAKKILLQLFEKGVGGEPYEVYEMEKGEKGVYAKTVSKDLNGVYYTYLVTSLDDDTEEAVDVYARATGANGKRGMVVDLSSTNPEGWENDKRVHLAKNTDAVLYEVHIRDFSISETTSAKNKGKLLGMVETGTVNSEGLATGIDHLKELGVTHVHLLPSFDYFSVDEENLDTPQFNWGYDPLNYNVPEGSYSSNPFDGAVRIKEYKEMVQKFHENGIGVVMDVVYNHTGYNDESYFHKTVPYYYHRTFENQFTDASACGNETASERSMVRKYMIDSLTYWMKEYHIDGFRFDLMGIHDIETMNQISDALHEISPECIIYGEGWTGGPSPLAEELRAVKNNTTKLRRIAAFDDNIRDGIKGHVFNLDEKGFVNGGEGYEEEVKFGIVGAVSHDQIDLSKCKTATKFWANNPTQCVNYVEAHDNLTLWDKLLISAEEASEEDRIKMDLLSNAIVILSQGIVFLHAGMDFIRTKGGEENSFASPDSVNAIDWDRKSTYKNVFDYNKGLLSLRKSGPLFRLETAEEVRAALTFLEEGVNWQGKNVIGYVLKNETEQFVVLYNANKTAVEITIPEGDYEVVVNETQAGVEAIEQFTGSKIEVPPISTLVLKK